MFFHVSLFFDHSILATKTSSGDVPPLLPPKQAYSDYSNLPSMNVAPKKPPKTKTIQVLPNKEKVSYLLTIYIVPNQTLKNKSMLLKLSNQFKKSCVIR